jgi:anti-sigma-K factor RskA
MSRDHEQYEENLGAYLLGALTELESEVFERHVATCAVCRQEFEQLRVASEALPRAVEPVLPPASLKKSLMETVMAEARERDQASRPERERRGFHIRLPSFRPAFAAGLACVLVLGIAIGWGITRIGSNGDSTVTALVDNARVPMGSASLEVRGDRTKGGVLRVDGMPQPASGQVYEVWIQRGGRMVPAGALFGVGRDGTGSAAIPDSLEGVKAVAVTREPQGGTREPTELPVLTFKLS